MDLELEDHRKRAALLNARVLDRNGLVRRRRSEAPLRIPLDPALIAAPEARRQFHQPSEPAVQDQAVGQARHPRDLVDCRNEDVDGGAEGVLALVEDRVLLRGKPPEHTVIDLEHRARVQHQRHDFLQLQLRFLRQRQLLQLAELVQHAAELALLFRRLLGPHYDLPFSARRGGDAVVPCRELRVAPALPAVLRLHRVQEVQTRASHSPLQPLVEVLHAPRAHLEGRELRLARTAPLLRLRIHRLQRRAQLPDRLAEHSLQARSEQLAGLHDSRVLHGCNPPQRLDV
eukprot:3936748-Rhodomonas_salina.2